MGRASHFSPHEIGFYEGLIFKTASMYAGFLEEDFEDVAQILRIKAWRALMAFDSRRSSLPVERYVFSCVKNQCKDLVKKRRRNELYIEDYAGTNDVGGGDVTSRFEARYLSSDEGQHFAHVDGPPLIPSTLTSFEREVVALLYLDYSQKEAAEMLGVRRNEMERAVRSVRDKMADWRPSPSDDRLAVAA